MVQVELLCLEFHTFGPSLELLALDTQTFGRVAERCFSVPSRR